MKALYIAWQDPETRRWHTVGRLNRAQGFYEFHYTRGALASPRFSYLGRMMDKEKTYRSDTLFPLFANRLLSESRPEYPDYLDWLGVDVDADELERLARSGGRRGTDHLCVYPEVEPDERGEMTIHFFSHGLRYLSRDEQTAISRLLPGNALYLKPEIDNVHDRYALCLETAEPIRVGYCPRYLNQDLHVVLNATPVNVTVEKVNLGAPTQYWLLCKAVFKLPDGFDLYSNAEHCSLSREAMAA
jgi:hypothetical protein